MKHRESRHGAEHDSIEQHSSGLQVWTLGVGMADGTRALTWKVPCALVAGVRLWCKVDLRRSGRADVGLLCENQNLAR